MKKFESIINTITDHLLLGLVLFVIFSLAFRCSSAQAVDTIRIQERSESVTTNLDNAANECKSESCKRAMRDAKDLIKDSLDIMINKDSEIKSKQKEIDNSSLYTSIGKYVVWGAVSLLILILLYVFKDQIISVIKIVRPI